MPFVYHRAAPLSRRCDATADGVADPWLRSAGAPTVHGMSVRSLADVPAEHDDRPGTHRAAIPAATHGPAALAEDLAAFAGALRSASAQWNEAVQALVPPAGGTSAAHRYARARAAWPTDPPPSYEEIAGLLAAVHDASGCLVAASGRFDAASRVAARALRADR